MPLAVRALESRYAENGSEVDAPTITHVVTEQDDRLGFSVLAAHG